MPGTVDTQAAKYQPRITVEYGKGRWSKVFHIFDPDNREAVFQQKDAVAMAKRVLEIAKEK